MRCAATCQTPLLQNTDGADYAADGAQAIFYSVWAWAAWEA